MTFCAHINPEIEITNLDAISDTDSDNAFSDKQNLQSNPYEEDEEEADESKDEDISNQDDDKDNGSQPDPSEVPEMNPPVLGQPDQPLQPNYDQNRDSTDTVDSLPQPDYSSVVSRGYPQTCQSGQYQCQKVDPNAPTRCIPEEWKCNGMRDCENSDDESGCSTDQISRGRPHQRCTQEQYQCHGTGINSVPPKCIDSQQVCDGTYQCSYGDDEANCRRDERQEERRDERRDDRRDYHQPTRHYEPIANTNDQNNANAMDRYAPRPHPQPQPQSDRKSEEYVQRLEWRDRCFRSCLKY